MINDVYMINWDEPDFEKNYTNATNILGININVISGIKGIHVAHLECAKRCSSDFFWCIDGDNWLYDSAKEDLELTETEIIDSNSVYVMRAKNPFNGLIYGHGAIKLFPKFSFLRNLDLNSVDMTSGVNLHYRIIHRLTSEHRYNSSPFHTWRTAFRECVKLSGSIIRNQNQKETSDRLNIWCDRAHMLDAKWSEENINGAILGRIWGKAHANSEKMSIINDFDKLRDMYQKC